MTPSVRRQICAQVPEEPEGFAVSNGSGCGVPDKETAWTLSKKHDGPPKRAVYRQTVLLASLIICWWWPWRGWPAIPGIRDTEDRAAPAEPVLRPAQPPAAPLRR